MKSSVLLMLTLLVLTNLYSQPVINSKDSSNNSEKPILYIYADKLPKFNYEGGIKNYVYPNFKYPFGGQMELYGTFFVSFVISRNGHVKDVEVINNVQEDYTNEIIRIFESMPLWEPGENDSKAIDVKMYFPFELILRSKKVIDSLAKLEKPILYLYADKLPKFNYEGGLFKYIYSNFEIPSSKDLHKTLLISFVVNKNGKVENIRVEKGMNIYCEQEPLSIFEDMPKWEPGEKDSKPVDVKMYLQIDYKCNQIFYNEK